MRRDGGRPTEICCRKLVSNHFKWLLLRVMVISIKVKRELKKKTQQVRYREMSYPEPMLTRRYFQFDIKTKDASISWDKLISKFRMLY